MKTKKPGSKRVRRELTPLVEASKLFKEGIEHLHGRRAKKARDTFQIIVTRYSEEREIVDRARTFIKVCDASRAKKTPDPTTVEELFTRGTYRLNDGDYDSAIEDFQAAQRLDSKADYLPFSMASAYALKGETASAAKALDTAIKMNPENRVFAVNDEDLEGVRGDPEIRKLLGIEDEP